MKLDQIAEQLGLELLTEGLEPDAEIAEGYTGDLLSNVLAVAQPGDLWITIQHHANVVAVAQVAGLSAVILANGVHPGDAMLQKARSARIPVLASQDSAFVLSGKLYALLASEGR